MQALYYSREKISKILNKRPISIISKNLLFISSVKFFLSLFEREAKENTQQVATNGSTKYPRHSAHYASLFFFFFFFVYLPRKTTSREKWWKFLTC